jgi:hypothetical protein
MYTSRPSLFTDTFRFFIFLSITIIIIIIIIIVILSPLFVVFKYTVNNITEKNTLNKPAKIIQCVAVFWRSLLPPRFKINMILFIQLRRINNSFIFVETLILPNVISMNAKELSRHKVNWKIKNKKNQMLTIGTMTSFLDVTFIIIIITITIVGTL